MKMHLHHFMHIFIFIFSQMIHIMHVSFEALKSGFEGVFGSYTRSNGVGKSKLAPLNSLQKELSNCLCFAYIIPEYDADPCVWSDDWWPSNKNMKTYTCTFIWTVYKWTTTILSFALVHWLSNNDPISILTFSLKVLHWRLTKLPITSTKLHLQQTLTTLIQITELT